MKKVSGICTILEKNDSHYYAEYVSKLTKPSVVFINKDGIVIAVSNYAALKKQHSNPNRRLGWWKEYELTPIECRQEGEKLFYMLYDENGNPKETNCVFNLPESKYSVSGIDTWDYEFKEDDKYDINTLYDRIQTFIINYFELEQPYRYHHLDKTELLNSPRKMTVLNTKNGTAYSITNRTVCSIADDLAEKNYGFATTGMITQTVLDFVVETIG